MSRSNITKSRNWNGKIAKTPGRLIGIGIIRIYQLTLSSIFGKSCRYFPTCSEYGYEAIARHGLFIGCYLTLCRLTRCNPIGSYGFDPVPDNFTKEIILQIFWKKTKKYFTLLNDSTLWRIISVFKRIPL
ncbi:membrane protein insertion efficiency factor YidD [Candidatus Liberibacter brunswickensis]|uniref:membrane protein insertion efficiency factor YidD n=1 Tax=Candidatus Liberibacter brunswickensis TaxID=1968796 RepID=UPI002FE22A92